MREGFRVKKTLRVIFERGLKKKGGMMLYRVGKRVERRRFWAETRQSFEPCEPITVHRTGWSNRGPDGSMLFSHGMVPYLKRTVKLNGSWVSRSDRTVRSGFNNLGQRALNFKLKTSNHTSNLETSRHDSRSSFIALRIVKFHRD